MLSASEAPTKPTAAVITTPAVIIVARVILECLGASDWLGFDVDLSFLPGLFIKTNKKPLKQQVNTVSAGFALSPVG
ncbi:hypothetical protein C6P10_10455 [Weissella confusa]|nr:hypothetical protein C6P10_10455 [Weissella confusa]